jgi:glutathione S-transferase
MQLYGSPTSPFVRKVRVLIAEKGIACPFVTEDPWQSRPEFLALNPIGKVPVLLLDDGKTLFESLAVMEYLDAQGTGARLMPPEGPRRWEVLRRHALGHGLIDAVVARLLETRRPEAFQMRDRMQREEDRVARIIAVCERELPKAGSLVGGALSIADLTLAVALSYTDFRYAHDWRSGAPRLAAWERDMALRPSLTSTLPPGFTRPA